MFNDIRPRWPIVLLVAISLVAVSLLLKPGFYLSHDGPVQVARIGAYHKAFTDLHIPPRWAGDLNYTYGAPVFNFYYPLPGYIGSLVHGLGFSLQDSFKLIIGAAFILATFSFYAWMRKLFNPVISFVAALFYGLAPYHFLDLYVRGDIGELVGFVFIPLIFWAVEEIKARPVIKNVILGSIFYALLVLSHNGLALIFSPTILLYAWLFGQKNKKGLALVTAMFVLGLGLSAYFWLPALYDSRFTNFFFFSGNLFKENFPKISQLIYSSWGSGPEVTKPEGLSPQIGPLHFLFFLSAVLLFLWRKLTKKVVLFWIIIFWSAFFLSSRWSIPIWKSVKLLSQLEFPWRLTALSSFVASILTGYVLAALNKKMLTFGCTVILFILSLPLVKIDKPINYSDSFYLSHAGTTTFHGEVSTIWAGSDAGNYPKQPLEVISGDARIVSYFKKTAYHDISLQSKSTSQILDNTLFFPGWGVQVDGRSVPIEFQDPNHRGLISFWLPPGDHRVVVSFRETPVRLLADILSLVSLVLVVLEWTKPCVRKLF